MTKRIGIYGGSFNPIHEGHTRLGRALCDLGLVDELWYVVSPHNPLKQAADLLSDEARLHLCRLAIQDDQRLRASDVEFAMPRPSYMADTLALLRRQHPDCAFTLVIGSDNWLSFPRWARPDEILRHHALIVYPRPGYPIDASALPPGVQLAPTPLIDISSTAIREAIRQGHFDGQGLAPQVWQEIKVQRYYGFGNDE